MKKNRRSQLKGKNEKKNCLCAELATDRRKKRNYRIFCNCLGNSSARVKTDGEHFERVSECIPIGFHCYISLEYGFT